MTQDYDKKQYGAAPSYIKNSDENSKPHTQSPSRNSAAREGKERIEEEMARLDLDLMKALVRRTKLLAKLRGGHKHAATPRAVRAEKNVRKAWEDNALRFSKDPLFVRQLFSLLQEVTMKSREEAEERTLFTLSPMPRPAEIKLTGPASLRESHIWASLMASQGTAGQLGSVLLGDYLADLIKALNQAGGRLSWTADGMITSTENTTTLQFEGKTFYVGESSLTFFTLLFLSLPQTGCIRFTGGSELKVANFTSVRHFLPQLQARLMHVIPKSTGLPVTLESAGLLPDEIIIPADLPEEAVTALLLAAAVWSTADNAPNRNISLLHLPSSLAMQALGSVIPIVRECGASVEVDGAIVTFSPSTLTVPAKPTLAMDPFLAAILLAVPAFTGGECQLQGQWPHALPEAQALLQLFKDAGIEVQLDATQITSCRSVHPPKQPLDGSRIELSHLPLLLALAAKGARASKGNYPVPLLPDEAGGIDSELIDSFWQQLGIIVQTGDDGKQTLELTTEDLASLAYTSPSPFWSMAFALTAYLVPDLKLNNPGNVTSIMPGFWSIYNTLPCPRTGERPTKEKHDAPSTRRRIIAHDNS